MLSFALAAALAQVDPKTELDKYNVVWTSPGTTEQGGAGSMPIGNGTFGANVWVEKDGDLLLLLSRTDSWSETDRLLKLGRVRVHMEPSPFAAGQPFRQELKLRDGKIEVTAGASGEEAKIRIYVNPHGPEMRIEGELTKPRMVTATLEDWRTGRKTFESDEELRSSWTMHSAPPKVRTELVWESPDIVWSFANNLASGVVWYHRNEHSVVPFTLKHQGLQPIRDTFKDPLIHRTFGGMMQGIAGSGLAASKATPNVIKTAAPTALLGIRITTHSAQTETHEEWKQQLDRLAMLPAGPDGVPRQTAEWWAKFWERSWIFAQEHGTEPAAAHPVPVNRHPLRVGADSHGQNVFRGWMTRASVYSRALSPEEIGLLAAGKSAADRPKIDGGEISCDVAGGSMIRDAPAWGCVNAFGPGCVWETAGELKDEQELGVWVTRFSGGHLRTVRQRTISLLRGLTLEAWIRPEKGLGPARILDKMTAGGSDGFIFDTHPGDSLRLIVGRSIIQAKGVLKQNSWQHVAATYDANTGRAVLYLDGKPIAEGASAARGWNDAEPPSPVTQAYVLQRWVQACGGGPRDGTGNFPIKFNGSIFTVEPRATEGQKWDADWRKWGGCFWWQNTRLPYYPMLAAGDFDMMDPLFKLYENALPGAVARTKLYYGAEGVYFPETMTQFGTYGNGDYGWQHEGKAPGDISHCPWWQFAWNQSLELSAIMLDYAAYTGDEKFLKERALPMARETLKYFDSRFKRDADGKLVITPTQAVETYWHGVVGDACVIGGLHTVCDQLLALPQSVGRAEDRALWKRVKDATPPVPTRVKDGRTLAAPAITYDDKRTNCETPELYPLWPFREFDLTRPGTLEQARLAFAVRADKSSRGWTQDGIFAARLGLAEEARAELLARAANSNPAHRFPAMWGPNFDWLPDQCHGGNLMTQTQLMLLQAGPPSAGNGGGDGTILLLPAWPKDWDVSFRLHAPGQTTVECVYRKGKIEKLVVTPQSRRKDVVMPAER